MILIADSGATKTDWRWIGEDGKIIQAQTAGINPFHQGLDKIADIVAKELPVLAATEIYFYGAGCGNDERKAVVKEGLAQTYPDSKILVESDMLGAARSLCQTDEGIVGILGTGVNSCYYNGRDIKTKMPSLGYVLGDEGSGAWLGKQLVHDYFGNTMDDHSRKAFEAFGVSNRDVIFSKVYQEARPAAFLASYSPLILNNIRHPYFYQLVQKGFRRFLNQMMRSYKNSAHMPISFTGSVAYFYGTILRSVATELGLYVKNIVQSPIAGLTLFHQKNNTR